MNLSSIQAEGRAKAFSMPLESIDPSDASLFENDTVHHYFERLRNEAPVHRSHSPVFGDYWSVTRYQDIMAVDTNHQVFSSDISHGGVSLIERPKAHRNKSFIASDPPAHDVERLAVSPIVAPRNLQNLESLIRERTCRVLDSLPQGETFDWVDKVSIELTTLMLATLFDFPLEDRRLLPWWSDVATSLPGVDDLFADEASRYAEMQKMAAYFMRLWGERFDAAPRNDLLSMMAHSPATRNLPPERLIGNFILLLIGGNDTTRNSMSGGLLALHEHPQEMAKLRANPALLDSAVPEIIRWQTPLAHMRRTAVADIELGGQQIKAGEKVVMWYLSGNRDERAIERPDEFLVDRARPRQHLSFGFGIHRCVGNRLAEMQLRILWEELLPRFRRIEVVGEPVRSRHCFIRGITRLPVRVYA